MRSPTKVDPAFSFAFTSAVGEAGPVEAVKAAYNACAELFKRGGRTPALVEVRVYAAPKEK